MEKTIGFNATTLLDRFPESVSDKGYNVLWNMSGPRPFGAMDSDEDELKQELQRVRIEVAKYCQVHKIPCDKIDSTISDDNFEYYRVDSGMNINVPQGKIKRLKFSLHIFADGKQSGDAFAINGFPSDKIRRVQILQGKIQLNINNLLDIIPSPVGQMVSNTLDVELNPWQIDWGYDRLEVGFSEGLTDNLDWILSSDNINQSFNCYFTLKKRKTVKVLTAKAEAIWEYAPHSGRAIGWLTRKLGKDKAPFCDKDSKEIKIIGNI